MCVFDDLYLGCEPPESIKVTVSNSLDYLDQSPNREQLSLFATVLAIDLINNDSSILGFHLSHIPFNYYPHV